MVSIARWVLPVLVGPRTAVILFLIISIFGMCINSLLDIVVVKEQNRLKHDRIGRQKVLILNFFLISLTQIKYLTTRT